MHEKEQKEIKEQVRNEFFKRFTLEFLDENGKQFTLKTAIQIAIFYKEFVNSYSGESVVACILNMQNLYSLTAIHENKESLDKINTLFTEMNQKFDELNSKFDTLIELLSKDKV